MIGASRRWMRPTSRGWGALVVSLAGVWALATWGSAGTARMVGSVAVAYAVIDALTLWRTLGRIRVRSWVPEELVAGSAADGVADVSCQGPVWLPMRVGTAVSRERVGPIASSAQTRFDLHVPDRGLALPPVVSAELISPLGCWLGEVVSESERTPILVLPRVIWPPSSSESGEEDEEIAELRPWRDGEPWRRVHAWTSARRGRPYVAVRSGRAASTLVIDLDRASERAIAEAAGRVLVAAEEGRAVGFSGVARPIAPASGPEHTRRLLEVLALLPVLAEDRA